MDPSKIHSPHTPTLQIGNTSRDGQDDEDNELLSNEEVSNEEIKAMVQAVLDSFDEHHSTEDESPPDLPAYHPSFTIVLSDCAEMFREAAALLQNSDYEDKHTQKLLDSISDKRDIQYDKPKRVGVVGGSGVGK